MSQTGGRTKKSFAQNLVVRNALEPKKKTKILPFGSNLFMQNLLDIKLYIALVQIFVSAPLIICIIRKYTVNYNL